MGQERRQSERRQPSAQASVALGESFQTVGTICDISATGLGIEYLDLGESIVEPHPRLDIFTLDSDFYLSRLHGSIMYDIPLERRGATDGVLAAPRVRRCGIRFENLSSLQRDQLDHFLDSYTAAHSAI